MDIWVVSTFWLPWIMLHGSLTSCLSLCFQIFWVYTPRGAIADHMATLLNLLRNCQTVFPRSGTTVQDSGVLLLILDFVAWLVKQCPVRDVQLRFWDDLNHTVIHFQLGTKASQELFFPANWGVCVCVCVCARACAYVLALFFTPNFRGFSCDSLIKVWKRLCVAS